MSSVAAKTYGDAGIIRECLLQQLGMHRNQSSSGNLAEVEAVLEGVHQRLYCGAFIACFAKYITVPVVRRGEGSSLGAVDADDFLPWESSISRFNSAIF